MWQGTPLHPVSANPPSGRDSLQAPYGYSAWRSSRRRSHEGGGKPPQTPPLGSGSGLRGSVPLQQGFQRGFENDACRNQAAGSGRRLWVTAKDAARGAPLWAVIHDPFVPISLKPKNQSAGEACSSSLSHLMTVGRLTPSARAISL